MQQAVKFTVRSRDGLWLVGDQYGSAGAPTVVLLHGGGQTRHSWGTAARALAGRGYHVLSYDARGHGDSSWAPGGDYSFASLADDLRDVLGEETAPVALIGASMGGMTAFRAVGDGLVAAAALVLVDIVPSPSKAGGRRITSFMNSHHGGFGSLEEAADAIAAFYPERERPADISGLRRNLREREDRRLYWHWDPRLFGSGPDPEPPDFREWAIGMAGAVQCPTLLVRGARSDVVDDAGVAELRQLVPQTEVLDVTGAGHMIVGDRNDAFNRGVIDFIARHLPDG